MIRGRANAGLARARANEKKRERPKVSIQFERAGLRERNKHTDVAAIGKKLAVRTSIVQRIMAKDLETVE
jgi:hypothetical protein